LEEVDSLSSEMIFCQFRLVVPHEATRSVLLPSQQGLHHISCPRKWSYCAWVGLVLVL